jgi:hypothetical protein
MHGGGMAVAGLEGDRDGSQDGGEPPQPLGHRQCDQRKGCNLKQDDVAECSVVQQDRHGGGRSREPGRIG